MTTYTDKELIEIAEKNDIRIYGTAVFKQQLLRHPKVLAAFEKLPYFNEAVYDDHAPLGLRRTLLNAKN